MKTLRRNSTLATRINFATKATFGRSKFLLGRSNFLLGRSNFLLGRSLLCFKMYQRVGDIRFLVNLCEYGCSVRKVHGFAKPIETKYVYNSKEKPILVSFHY
jgi:hypothetical protein